MLRGCWATSSEACAKRMTVMDIWRKSETRYPNCQRCWRKLSGVRCRSWPKPLETRLRNHVTAFGARTAKTLIPQHLAEAELTHNCPFLAQARRRISVRCGIAQFFQAYGFSKPCGNAFAIHSNFRFANSNLRS